MPVLPVAAVLLLTAAPAAAQPPPPPYPTNSAPPQVTGTEPRQDGQTVSAYNGTWNAAPQSTMTFSYQWVRCAPSGAGCEAIPGATGQTYTLSAGEAGRRVKVQVTANCTHPEPICQKQTRESGLTGTVLPDPNNEGAPQVTGSTIQRQLLYASAGFWRSITALTYGYQWLRCDAAGGGCINVAGATGQGYRLTATDVGHTMRVAVTASSARPSQATATSAATTAVSRRGPAPVGGLRFLSPFPTIVVAGVVSGSAVSLSEFSIRGPRRATVSLKCRARGCPFRRKRFRLRSRRVHVRSLERRVRAGVRLRVTITRPGFVGKYTRFRFRRGRVPARTDLCLPFGAKRPNRCPRGI